MNVAKNDCWSDMLLSLPQFWIPRPLLGILEDGHIKRTTQSPKEQAMETALEEEINQETLWHYNRSITLLSVQVLELI